MKNKEIAEIFNNIATFLEMKEENFFKVRAYRKAAENIESLGEDIADLRKEGRLSGIPGIGQALEEKISEYLDTGRMKAYEELKKEFPESLLEMVNIPSVGPKKAKLFYQQLKIKSIEELKEAAEDRRLLGLPGIQEKTVENILHGIKILKEGQERMNLALATRVAESFVDALKKLPEVKRISPAGSLRRMKETIRDIDILVDSSSPAKVMEAFVSLPQVKEIVSHGETKSSVLTQDHVQVDLRVVDSHCYGAALLYFTGSKNFNVRLRQVAIKKKTKLSEYGLFSIKGKQEKFLAGKTEEDMLRVLGLPSIPPELREDIGEARLFSSAQVGAGLGPVPSIKGQTQGLPLPKLIEITDIRGELHAHSTWSDGRNSIAEMAQAAQERGYEYIAITDHSPSLRVAGGVAVSDLKKKKKQIDELNGRFKNFRILYGTEVEIDSDGNLDYNDATLSEFDIVIAAIHSGFEQSKFKLTQRLLKAIQNKYVHIIAHPTGVHLGKRDPYEIDFKEICKAASDTQTFLEINSFPLRLDLNSANVYFAKNQGVKFVINTDAHGLEHLDFMKYGIAVARRGWLEAKDVFNTLSLQPMLKAIHPPPSSLSVRQVPHKGGMRSII